MGVLYLVVMASIILTLSAYQMQKSHNALEIGDIKVNIWTLHRIFEVNEKYKNAIEKIENPIDELLTEIDKYIFSRSERAPGIVIEKYNKMINDIKN